MTMQPWRPLVIDPSSGEARDLLDELVRDPRVLVQDTLDQQLDELLASRDPAMTKRERAVMAASFGDSFGCWIYYPWSSRLIRALPPAELREVRLARNQYKITKSEQQVLATKTIAIVGLSVGRQIARTLAMEGVGGRFRLADGDLLSLSNLNRLPARIADLGISKCVLAARELFEIDPYLEIEVFSNGVDADSIDEFALVDGIAPDIVVEECDDFAVKIRLRERMRQLRVPVVMESSARGTLDVERYDLEPTLPLLHGLLEGIDPNAPLDADGRSALVAHVLPHLGVRMRSSIAAVGTALRSWPQLASEVALGAATATVAVRRILLDQPAQSGRYVFDIGAVGDEPIKRGRPNAHLRRWAPIFVAFSVGSNVVSCRHEGSNDSIGGTGSDSLGQAGCT